MSKQTNTDLQFPGSKDGDLIPVPAIGTSFAVSVGSTSTATAAVLSTTTGLAQDQILLRITATTDCFVASAAAPTAVADGTDHYLPAGVPQDLRFPATHKLAFIRLAADGAAYCTPLV